MPQDEQQETRQEYQDRLPDELRQRMTRLGSALRSQWESEAIPERYETERRWIEDLYQYRSEYSQSERNRMEEQGSKVFPPATRKKVTTIYSRLRDLLFPPSEEQNWSLAATNEPVLPPHKEQEAKKRAKQKALEKAQDEQEEAPDGQQPGAPDPVGPGGSMQPPTPDDDDLEAARQEVAEETAESMSDRIKEQLDESRYSEIGGRVILSGCIYGTGILKGPLVDVTVTTRYTIDPETGAWVAVPREEFRPYNEQVSVWDIFPDMGGKDWHDLRYIYQRHRMLKQDVLALADRDDFDGETIVEYVQHHKKGDARDRGHETELRDLGDRASVGDPNRGRFEVLEYWGVVDAEDLIEAAPELREELETTQQELWANVWLVGEWVVKAVISPAPGDKKHPFHAFEFDTGDTSSIFCHGVPALMRDDQKILGAATRAMMDNSGVASGPMLEVNEELLAQGEDANQIYPRRIFRRVGRGQEAQYPAVRNINVNSHINEFLALIQQAEGWIHEHTVPSYLEGQGTTNSGAQGTAQGLSMLMGAANIELKSLARNYDEGVTVPFIGAMYAWNMEFSEDEDIKGDYEVYARGSASMVAKEQRAAQLDQFAAQEAQMPTARWVKWRKLLKQRMEAHDLSDDELILTEEEFQDQQGPDPEQRLKQIELQLKSAETQATVEHKKAETEKLWAEIEKTRAEAERERAEAAKAAAEAEGYVYQEPDEVDRDQDDQGGAPSPGGGGPASGRQPAPATEEGV